MYDFEILCVPVLAVEVLWVSVLDVTHRSRVKFTAPSSMTGSST